MTLYNDVKVPLLGIGTFMISPEDTEQSVCTALKDGYRMIDTANTCMNEEAVANTLDGTKEYYNPSEGEDEKCAGIHLPFEN